MKNSLLLSFSLSLFLISISAFSQSSIEVQAHEKNVTPANSSSTLDLATEITVRNTSDATVDIKVSREVLSETDGTENYFCWVSCYLSIVSVSPDSKLFSAGEVDNSSFAVHFNNLSVELASATIRYCAFNAANEADSACTIVNFSTETSAMHDLSSATTFSDFHPNPTASVTKLNYTLGSGQSAKVVVTDMLGNTIQQALINDNKEGTLVFDVSNTPKGLYFANIYVNNKISEVKSLIVNR